MRKINDFKNDALKMLKTMQIYLKNIFLDFCCFSLFLDFLKILSKRWVKNWVTTTDSNTTFLDKITNKEKVNFNVFHTSVLHWI